MMKILHVITSLKTGGAEKLLVDLLPRLQKLGNEVDLLLFDGTKTPFYKYLVKSGIKIFSLTDGGNVYNPFNVIRLKKFISNYNIIHTHNTACQYYVPIAKILFNAKCRLITTEHSSNNRRRNNNLLRVIDKYIYKKYSKIIAISNSAKDKLISHLGYNQNIQVIYNGIDLKIFENSNNRYPSFNSEIIITMIAGFRYEKDQDTVIKAISLLPSNYKLWLVGDGTRRQILEELVTNLNITKRVVFWGNQTDISKIIKESHIIVLSSHCEGFGLSAVEGMASNRPVIATDIDGLNEIVGMCGVLVPPNDAEIMAQKISLLCKDLQKYAQITDKCHNRSKDFDINLTATNYSKLYNT